MTFLRNCAIRGFHSVNLPAEGSAADWSDPDRRARFHRRSDVRTSLVRFKAGDTAIGGIVDIHVAGSFLPGRMGGGSAHHIAFRAADDAEELAMAKKLAENHGLHTTEQKDRNYFRSVYFREPGHVLFEIATDIPGFAIDEPLASLGRALKLPPEYEGRSARRSRTCCPLLPDSAKNSSPANIAGRRSLAKNEGST